jgi:hypothetical protein
LEDEIERRTLTYSRWENSVKGKGRQGWHPVTFSFADASLKAITDVQVCVLLQPVISFCCSEAKAFGIEKLNIKFCQVSDKVIFW